MSKGIYLVANKKSEALCSNLVFTIRSSGCKLPIRIIYFGGKKITSTYLKNETSFLTVDDFGKEAIVFIDKLKSVLTECPVGFLYRYLGFWGDWDEFIYSDNDVVALNNWETLIEYLKGNDIVNADLEYTTKGIYNFNQPKIIEAFFGEGSLQKAVTAGHITVKKSSALISDILKAAEWIKNHPGVVKINHEQGMLHIALLIGNWKNLNLCKPPNNWLSSWSGDYKNSLNLIQSLQSGELKRISHLHYSGSSPKGNLPIEELLFSNYTIKKRLYYLTGAGIKNLSGFSLSYSLYKKVIRKLSL